MNYRREIDGLRSVAVLPVIFFHAGVTVFSGGYVGVDIFFVISGYLITGIIFQELTNNKFTISNFYERRARRILPALFFVVALCIPFAWAWMSPSQLVDFSQSLVAVTLFSSNILFWRESGYFAPAAELQPLLHTWSLAVEEQYYVFFPIFIMSAWRWGMRAIFFVLLVIGSVSLLVSHWGAASYPKANFYLLPTRLWELLLGSLVAIHMLQRATGRSINGSSAKWRLTENILSFIGLVLVLYSIFAFDDRTPFPSFYALVPTLGTALIIVFASTHTIVSRILGSRILVGIGLISYSAYLWHQPLFAFAKIRSLDEPSHILMVFLGLLSLGLAYLSWRFVEKPFRNRDRLSRKSIFQYAFFVSLIAVGIGVLGVANDGFSGREIATGEKYAEANLDHRFRANNGLSRKCDGNFALESACRTSDQPEVLVWGDSFAMHLIPGILSSNSNAKIIQFTKSVCGPIIGISPTNRDFPEKWARECLKWNDNVARWIKENDSLRYAVLSSPFGQYLNTDWEIRNSSGVFSAEVSKVLEYFKSTLDFLLLEGIQPVVFTGPPLVGKHRDIGACLVKAITFGDDMRKCDISKHNYKENRKNIINFLGLVGKEYRVISMDEFLCSKDTCSAARDGTFIYRDYGHFSYEGAAFVGSGMDFYHLITAPSDP